MKFVFVILHYNTFNQTLECIEHIKKLYQYNNTQIIVIDNFSKDDSLNRLKEKFEFSDVEVISSELNVGFAKGNNLGYTIGKYKYKAEYIICLNSDVYIKQKEFLDLIDSKYEEKEYHLLGPKIINLDKENQNPVSFIHDDKKKINKTLLKNRLRWFKSYLPQRKVIGTVNSIIIENDKELEDVPLHGSCIIASPKYIQSHEFLFFPDTFLYGEEDILFYLSKINKEKLLYFPSVQVLHLEDASTNQSFGELSASKKRFILKHSSESLKVLKNLMNKKS